MQQKVIKILIKNILQSDTYDLRGREREREMGGREKDGGRERKYGRERDKKNKERDR